MRIPIFDIDDNIDEKGCLEMLDNQYDFYEAVLNSFVTHGRKEIDRLKETMESGDRENYRIVVHGLKSSAGSVGDKNLQAFATMIDAACKKGEWNVAEDSHLKLITDYENLIKLIENRLERE